MATCLVCNANVDEDAARAESGQTVVGATEVDPTKGTRRFHEGTWYYFDTMGCRSQFMASPDTYISTTSS